jgi:hypothetical protein
MTIKEADQVIQEVAAAVLSRHGNAVREAGDSWLLYTKDIQKLWDLKRETERVHEAVGSFLTDEERVRVGRAGLVLYERAEEELTAGAKVVWRPMLHPGSLGMGRLVGIIFYGVGHEEPSCWRCDSRSVRAVRHEPKRAGGEPWIEIYCDRCYRGIMYEDEVVWKRRCSKWAD